MPWLLDSVAVGYLRRSRFRPGWIGADYWLPTAGDGPSTRRAAGYPRDRGAASAAAAAADDEPNLGSDWRPAASKRPRPMIDAAGASARSPLSDGADAGGAGGGEKTEEDGPDDR